MALSDILVDMASSADNKVCKDPVGRGSASVLDNMAKPSKDSHSMPVLEEDTEAGNMKYYWPVHRPLPSLHHRSKT